MIVMHGISSVESEYALPEHCILLDYFQEGYRFGENTSQVVPSSILSVRDTDTYNLSYFNHSFSTGFPAGVFDYPHGTSPFLYTLDNALANGEFTVEYLIRFDSTSTNYTGALRVNYSDYGHARCDCVSYDKSSQAFGYVNKTRSWDWLGPQNMPSGWIDGSRTWNGWHHVAICFKNNESLKLFIDGTLVRNVTYMYNIFNSKKVILNLVPYAWELNEGTKLGKYMISQLAVWDIAKWESNFSVDKRLIFNMV